MQALTEKLAKAEARATKLEKALAAKTVEIEEMYEGFNSVQDTFIAQMNRLDTRINGLSPLSTDRPQNLSPLHNKGNETVVNRMDTLELTLASLEATISTLKEQA